MTDIVAYLKPRTSDWLPLTEKSFIALNEDQDPSEPLGPEGKRLLSEYKQHINDMLSSALQLPNLTFLAGSGTSLGEVNGPSMWDLWRRSMWERPDAKDGESDYEVLSDIAVQVCEIVRYEYSEQPNIEHFLSQCDAYLGFNDDSTVRSFVIEVKKVILDACTSFLNQKGSDISAHGGLLQKLARRRVRDPRLKVFTTNYDMCFESAASELGMMIIDGFSYTRNRRFDGKFFDYDVVRRENESHEFVEGIIQLYKLHGSVSWERSDDSIFEKTNPDPARVALIYPAKGKYQQAFMQPHLELFSRFIASLRIPNSCLIISGFGFNDDHLSEPIISAIKSNPSLKLIVSDHKAKAQVENSQEGNEAVSKYWGELASLAEAGYDIHFLNMSFSNFVALVPNLRALSPAEQLAKAVKQAGN